MNPECYFYMITSGGDLLISSGKSLNEMGQPKLPSEITHLFIIGRITEQ